MRRNRGQMRGANVRKGDALGVAFCLVGGRVKMLVFGKRYDCVIPSLRLDFFFQRSISRSCTLSVYKSAEFGGHTIQICFTGGAIYRARWLMD